VTLRAPIALICHPASILGLHVARDPSSSSASFRPDVSVAYRLRSAAIPLAPWCAMTGRSLRFDRRAHAFLALQGVLLFASTTSGCTGPSDTRRPDRRVVFSTIVFMNPVVRGFAVRHRR